MGQLKIFENEEFGQIRTVMRDGEVWFVGKDVAEALGYGKGKSLANAVSDHVDPEDKGVTKMMTPGGNQKVTTYNEIGKKVFAECNRDLKHYFHVNARNNMPKKRYYEALEYIQEWKPCTNTQIQIHDCNAQVCMP